MNDIDFELEEYNTILRKNDKFPFTNPAYKGQIIKIELDEFASKVSIFDILGNEIYTINEIRKNIKYQLQISIQVFTS